MRPVVAIVCLFLWTGYAHAARIVSDPYPVSAPQPDSCGFVEGAAAPVISPVERLASGSVRCSIVLPGTLSGVHTYQIFAKSTVWGNSASVTFTFRPGKPVSPSGLRTVP